MGAVFGQINAGAVTSGLRKVTSDMKTKNMKDKPALEPQGTSAPKAAAPAAAKVEPKKDPEIKEEKGTIHVRYFDNAGVVDIPDLALQKNVYLLKVKNTTITINEKVKSIQVDGCQRVNLVFKSVVSLVEVFNSQRSDITCTDVFPSIQIDKSNGIVLHLSRQGLAHPPSIVTSNVNEINVSIPGPGEDDDPIEMPLPEQYVTVFRNGKLATEPVTHSGA